MKLFVISIGKLRWAHTRICVCVFAQQIDEREESLWKMCCKLPTNSFPFLLFAQWILFQKHIFSTGNWFLSSFLFDIVISHCFFSVFFGLTFSFGNTNDDCFSIKKIWKIKRIRERQWKVVGEHETWQQCRKKTNKKWKKKKWEEKVKWNNRKTYGRVKMFLCSRKNILACFVCGLVH